MAKGLSISCIKTILLGSLFSSLKHFCLIYCYSDYAHFKLKREKRLAIVKIYENTLKSSKVRVRTTSDPYKKANIILFLHRRVLSGYTLFERPVRTSQLRKIIYWFTRVSRNR